MLHICLFIAPSVENNNSNNQNKAENNIILFNHCILITADIQQEIEIQKENYCSHSTTK